MTDLIDILADPHRRLETIYTIVDKNSKRVKFQPNKIQSEIFASKSKRKAVLKARQFGVSTGCILKLFDDTIWNRDRTNVILAHEQDAIKKLFRIVRRAYEFLEPELKPEIARGGGSKYEMYFPAINSLIYCDLESRGDTINNLHISEAAFSEKERIDATMQAVPLTGNVTFETTPNGIGNWFYDFWNEDTAFEKLFYPWFFHDEYRIVSDLPIILTIEEREFCYKVKKYFGRDISKGQINYRRFKQNEMRQSGGLSFMQEYPEDDNSCFLTSGNPAIDLQLVAELKKKAPKPLTDLGHLKTYKQPIASRSYVIGADVAEGVGGDYSVGIVLDVESREEIAIMRGYWKPGDFAHRLNDLGKMFTVRGVMPLIAVERNNHGHAVLLELDEHIHYPRLFRADDDRLGWKTDRITRPVMIDILIQGIENQTAHFNSDYFLGECLTLINNDGKIEAAEGKHDDCIIAGAIALSIAIDKAQSIAIYSDLNKKIRI